METLFGRLPVTKAQLATSLFIVDTFFLRQTDVIYLYICLRLFVHQHNSPCTPVITQDDIVLTLQSSSSSAAAAAATATEWMIEVSSSSLRKSDESMACKISSYFLGTVNTDVSGVFMCFPLWSSFRYPWTRRGMDSVEPVVRVFRYVWLRRVQTSTYVATLWWRHQ